MCAHQEVTNTFYLLDGNSLLYRAYYAIPHLSNRRGEPTNAVYGLTNIIFKLLRSHSIHYIACAFDSPGPTRRHQKFSLYKIHRPGMPGELVSQLPVVKEVLAAMGLAIFEKEGYEADDILATLAEKGKDQGFGVVIVSGDRDILQLVDENISILQPGKEDKEITLEKVREVMGVNSSQIPDLIGLKGDNSDGIPGIPGIGPKTAVKLINQFGSIETLYQELAKLESAALAEKLEKYRQECYLSRDLAILDRQVPLEIDWSKCRIKELDKESLVKLFRRLGFNTLINRILAEDGDKEKTPVPVACKGKSELDELIALARGKKEIFIYFEKKKNELLLAADSHSLFLLSRPWPLAKMKELLSDREIRKISSGFKELLKVIWSLGLDMEGLYFDLEIASYLLDPERPSHDLNGLSLDYFARNLGGNYGEIVTVILKLKETIARELKEAGEEKLFFEVEMPLVKILARMEAQGVRVNQDKLKKFSIDLADEISVKEERIFALAGERFNLNSPQQLGRILFHKLGLPPQRKIKTGFSTDSEVLETLAPLYPVAFEVLSWRELYKIKSTYVDGLLKLINPTTSRLHTTFNQTITATGRLSSSNPNLQNIPIGGEMGKKLRSAFEAGPKKLLLSADYSQIELRLLAHLANDRVMKEAFRNDEDIHVSTARHVFKLGSGEVSGEMRRRAKTINFGIIYGMSAYGLARELHITSEEAQSYIDQYLGQYPEVRSYLASLIKEARARGFSQTILGRRRPIRGLDIDRLAVNTPIQGSAADIIKLAMVGVAEEVSRKKLKAVLILQVHDELLFELPEKELEETCALIRPIMENVFPLSIPLKVNISWGNTWAELD